MEYDRAAYRPAADKRARQRLTHDVIQRDIDSRDRRSEHSAPSKYWLRTFLATAHHLARIAQQKFAVVFNGLGHAVRARRPDSPHP